MFEMCLNYQGKKSESEILSNSPKAILKAVDNEANKSKIIFGENLGVLNTLLSDHNMGGKVDLIYIDPPFSTNNHFRISQDRANTISSSNNDEVAYSDKLVGAQFLEFLRERLIFLRELMSERASIYLHIDYKIGHYVKIIMDEIFGRSNFRNDIARIKCNPKNFGRKGYGNIKDLILFYSKTNTMTWNEPKVALSDEEKIRLFHKVDKSGRYYTTIPLHAPGETANGKTGGEWKGIKPPKGRHWRSDPAIFDELDAKGLIEWSSNGVPRKIIYADEKEGKKIQDIWEYKDPQYPTYPTEKNIDLLKLIINASSNPEETVLDCFSGSGSTLLAASQLSRFWIGIDNSAHAVNVTRDKLANLPQDLFSKFAKYDYLIQINNSQLNQRHQNNDATH